MNRLPWHAVYHDIEVFRPDLYSSGIGSKVYVNVPPGLMFSAILRSTRTAVHPTTIILRRGSALPMMCSATVRPASEAEGEYS